MQTCPCPFSSVTYFINLSSFRYILNKFANFINIIFTENGSNEYSATVYKLNLMCSTLKRVTLKVADMVYILYNTF